MRFTAEGNQRIAEIRRQLHELRNSGLSGPEEQAQVDSLMNDLSDVLQTETVPVGREPSPDAQPPPADSAPTQDTTPAPDTTTSPSDTTPSSTTPDPTSTQPDTGTTGTTTTPSP